MASLYSRTYKSNKTGKTTTYWYVSYYREGKRHAKCAGTSKSVAGQLKKRVEAELRLGKFDFLNQPGDFRIDSSISTYLEHVEILRKLSTYKRYRSALANLRRFLEVKYPSIQVVRKLTEGHFQEYQSWRRAGLITPNGSIDTGKKRHPTFKTINNELSVFRSWLNWAITAGHIHENPLKGVRKLKTTDSKERQSLSAKEYKKLIAASEEIERVKPSRKGQTLLWRFLVSTGLRIGELIHLQWKDIDFRRQVIKIQRKPDWDPKTFQREVPFTPGAAEVLRNLRGKAGDGDALVFLNPSRNPYRQNKVRDRLLECAKKAEITDMHGPHDLRHTFITLGLTEYGIDLPTMMKIAGHSRLETTQAYIHPTTDHIHSAAQKFDL